MTEPKGDDGAPLPPLHALLDAVGRVVQEARHHPKRLPPALIEKIADMERASGPDAVRAVNGEAELLSALRALLADYEELQERVEQGATAQSIRVVNKALAAIEKAEGKE